MDADEILALQRELTDEEFTFLEQDTLRIMRAIRKRIQEFLPRLAAQDAQLAERLEVSSNRMLWALEEGADLPIGDKVAETAALKDLRRQVRRMYVEIMGPPEEGMTQPVRSSRRDRRRLGRRERKRGPWNGPRAPESGAEAG